MRDGISNELDGYLQKLKVIMQFPSHSLFPSNHPSKSFSTMGNVNLLVTELNSKNRSTVPFKVAV